MFYQKNFWLLAIDFLIIILAFYTSLLFQNQSVSNDLLISLALFSSCYYAYAFIFRFYKKVWYYANAQDFLTIFRFVFLSTVSALILDKVLKLNVTTYTIILVGLIVCLVVNLFRILILYKTSSAVINKKKQKIRTLIIGAGSAGTMVVHHLLQNENSMFFPIAFIDDDITKKGMRIQGIPVVANLDQVSNVVKQMKIERIVIAIPSLSDEKLQFVIQKCSKCNVKTQVLPKLEDLISGKISVNEWKDVDPEKLLGREPLVLDSKKMNEIVNGETVLVTGAGGSIGSEICRQISMFSPKKLVLLGHGENSIYIIEQELKTIFQDEILFVLEIADIRDRERIFEVINKHRPKIIYHAAAHKHVPLMEQNPHEAIKNNIIGTINCADAASKYTVETFILISSDKAVKPTSVMGASKRLAETMIQHMNPQCKTKFATVRFGNVLGSRGSVIPLFKRQIQAGGPVTVTHPEMTRYFMTIPEASRLVIQASMITQGGEIFILEMGDPVKIVDLAKNLIELSRHSIDEIGIKFTGIRPGEKLNEELLNDEEVYDKQIFPKIYIGKAIKGNLTEIKKLLAEFNTLSTEELKTKLLEVANSR